MAPRVSPLYWHAVFADDRTSLVLQMNIDVAIVTAAGYPGDASKFEGRLQGLLKAFERHKLPASITNRCAPVGTCKQVPNAGCAAGY